MDVLAMLGDNPMQSEFACHIGLRGKFFCRCCWVKGYDARDNADGDSSQASTSSSKAESTDGPTGRKRTETLAVMLARIKRFVVVSCVSRYRKSQLIVSQ
jgi:hypothetical protein